MCGWAVILWVGALPAFPQPPLEYAQSVAGRMRSMRDAVVAAHGLGRIAALVCSRDRIAGAALFQETARALSVLNARAFVEPTEPLPVPSFTALFRTARAAAVACEPALGADFDTDRSFARMREESGQANVLLQRARTLLEQAPGRALQLAQVAMSASHPVSLDVPDLGALLSKMRDRAPDLADELFADALDFVVSAPDPSPAALMELGKYVFVAPLLWKYPDAEHRSLTAEAGGVAVVNLGSIRQSSGRDDAAVYTEAVLKVIAAAESRNYNATVACALARQMLQYAAVGPDALEELKRLYVQLAVRPDAHAAEVHTALGLRPPDLAAIVPATYEGLGAIMAAVREKRFAEARQLAKYVENQATRAQAADAVDFAEAADAIGRRDLVWATTLANGMASGVKRALLYAGIAAAAPDREAAFGVVQLALKDASELASEHRMFTLLACAAALLRLDPDTAMPILAQHITAANDAAAQPWKGRRGVTPYIRGAPARAVVLFNHRGLVEVMAAPAGRFRYPLRVPAVTALTLPAFVVEAKTADVTTLEAAILGLRSETQLADALVALARLRLATAN